MIVPFQLPLSGTVNEHVPVTSIRYGDAPWLVAPPLRTSTYVIVMRPRSSSSSMISHACDDGAPMKSAALHDVPSVSSSMHSDRRRERLRMDMKLLADGIGRGEAMWLLTSVDSGVLARQRAHPWILSAQPVERPTAWRCVCCRVARPPMLRGSIGGRG